MGVAALLTVGCAGGTTESEPASSSAVQADRLSTLAPSKAPTTSLSRAAQQSVLDALDEATVAKYDEASRQLLDLVVGPGAMKGHRLLSVQVDDPNGNGRIDGRWYPPRVVRSACTFKLDNAPMPMATAVLVPGDRDAAPKADPMEAASELVKAPYVISLLVQLFDDSSQRDAFAAATAESYDAMKEFSTTSTDCGRLTDALGTDLGRLASFKPHDAGYPGFGVFGRILVTPMVSIHYRVGDRVMLSVGMQAPPKQQGEPRSVLDRAVLDPLIDAQVERLRSKALG